MDKTAPAAGDRRSRIITLSAYALLLFTFTLDVLTPGDFRYPYTYPIMLAALTTRARLTWHLAIASIFANTLSVWVDLFAGDTLFTSEYMQTRMFATISAILIGYLVEAVQRSNERSARIVALQFENERELAVSRAADRIVGALSTDRVIPTMTAEAVRVFNATAALWIPAQSPRATIVARRSGDDVQAVLEPPDPGVLALADRLGAQDHVPRWESASPAVRQVMNAKGDSLLSIPVTSAGEFKGMLLASPLTGKPDESAVASAQSFARIASSAMEEARLQRELASQNESLQERQQVIEELVDAIAHDVRTPLKALTMTLQQAIEGAYGALPPDYAEVLNESRISIDDIHRLAETLLLVARFEAGTPVLAKEPIDVVELCEELCVEFRALAAARSVELRPHFETGATVIGSRPNLRRAVANLMANAIHNTPPHGMVELRVGGDGGSVAIAVCDDGFGVDPAFRPMLFQRFARGTGTGTGLGLYIVRRVAESMGGSVRFEEREPRGASFCISLPQAQPAAIAR
jgi:signal transduction histidine kinase